MRLVEYGTAKITLRHHISMCVKRIIAGRLMVDLGAEHSETVSEKYDILTCVGVSSDSIVGFLKLIL